MVYITGILDEDVWPKIDTQYVMSRFSSINLDAVIVLVCTQDNKRKEDRWEHKGKVYYTIHLPYDQVKATEDIRPMMLELVAKRLGIPVPGPAGAVSS